MSKKIAIGFLLLPLGIVLTPLLPEVGIPIILLSTRYLQERYEWARRLNLYVDAKYQAFKQWLGKFRRINILVLVIH
jgi:hypothetical protein